MTDEQTKLLITIVALLVNSGLLGALALAARSWLLGHLGAQRYASAASIAHEAVQAIEQIAKTDGWTNADKLNSALAQARALGEAHGIHLDDTEWSTLLESAVKAMHDFAPLIEATAPPVVNVTNVTPPAPLVAPSVTT